MEHVGKIDKKSHWGEKRELPGNLSQDSLSSSILSSENNAVPNTNHKPMVA